MGVALFLLLAALLTWAALASRLERLGAPRGDRRRQMLLLGAAILLWWGLAFVAGERELFRATAAGPPYIAVGFTLPFIAAFVLFRRWTTLRRAVDALPVHWVIGMQVYRLGGLGFLLLYREGLLPASFAYPIGLVDVVVGASAALVAHMFARHRPYARAAGIVWNIAGLIAALDAVSFGFFATPGPFQLVSTTPSIEAARSRRSSSG